MGNFYASTLLDTLVRDVANGYRLWRFEALRNMPLNRRRSDGYGFQIEMVDLAHCLKYHIDEIPIYFAERQNGKSKMSFQILIEAPLRTWQMPLIYRNTHGSSQVLKMHEIN